MFPKVLFRFAKIPCGLQDMKESLSESSRDTLRDSASILNSAADGPFRTGSEIPQALHQTKCPDEKLGFIMCECGVEGISLKVFQ